MKYLFYFFLFIPSLEMAASSCHIEQPQDNGDVFSEMYMLAGLARIMLTGID